MNTLEIETWKTCSGFKNHRNFRIPDYRDRQTGNTAYKKLIEDQERFRKRINQKIGNTKPIDPYPLSFNYAFKERIRKRFYRKCFICGISEEDYHIKLDVHHIDYNKQNMDETNFVPLCRGCHGMTTKNREYWERNIKKKLAGKLDEIPTPGFQHLSK